MDWAFLKFSLTRQTLWSQFDFDTVVGATTDCLRLAGYHVLGDLASNVIRLGDHCAD